MFKDLLTGTTYVLKGYRLITRSGLRRFFLIPLTVNVIVFTVLIWLGINQFGELMNWLLPTGDSWWTVLSRVVMWVLFAVSALLILFFFFTLLANLIGSPFNSLLAEKVEKLITGENIQQESASVRGFISDIPLTLLNELRKMIYFIIFTCIVLASSLIPVVQIVFPIVWIILTSWMLALEYISYPMENHGLRFKEVRSRIKEKPMRSLGFGFAVAGATLLPVANLVVMPAAVAGATMLWVDHLARSNGS